MPDEQTQELISQLSHRKLAFVRRLLRAHEVPVSGTRDKLVERLNDAVDEGQITPDAILALLNELDAWGKQRVKLARFEPRFLNPYRNEAEVRARLREAGMEHLLGREGIDLNPPKVLTPMRIGYVHRDGKRLLQIVAAKTRFVDRPETDLPELNVEGVAVAEGEIVDGIVYKPFRRERQKVISFAEVDLGTGFVMISTTLKYRVNYRPEFDELLALVEGVVPLRSANPILLFRAVHEIKQLSHDEVRIYSRKAESPTGGSVDLRSHSSKTDLRLDPALLRADNLFGNEDCVHCNCRWQPGSELVEEVHTHVFAPAGEVSVLGQVTEASARHVLQRIRALN
ncbi:MAG: hypothetical protein H0X65_11225 [Gemmatimonadetes bacterium]|nr:hypothetical protein [Gemmatimonadota bacterium]